MPDGFHTRAAQAALPTAMDEIADEGEMACRRVSVGAHLKVLGVKATVRECQKIADPGRHRIQPSITENLAQYR